MNNTKTILFNIDGVLINCEKPEYKDITIETIKKCRKKGFEIFVTSRIHVDKVQQILEELKITKYIKSIIEPNDNSVSGVTIDRFAMPLFSQLTEGSRER